MLKIEDIAEIVLGNLEYYNKHNAEQQKLIYQPMYKYIRDIAFNPLNWGKKRGVSRAAQEFAEKNKFGNELKYIKQTQLTKLKDPNRSDDKGKTALVLEHFVPAKQLMDELLDIKKPTLQDVINVMEKADVKVITWKEHEKLEKTGNKDKRPDPKKAYKDAGIELIK